MIGSFSRGPEPQALPLVIISLRSSVGQALYLGLAVWVPCMVPLTSTRTIFSAGNGEPPAVHCCVEQDSLYCAIFCATKLRTKFRRVRGETYVRCIASQNHQIPHPPDTAAATPRLKLLAYHLAFSGDVTSIKDRPSPFPQPLNPRRLTRSVRFCHDYPVGHLDVYSPIRSNNNPLSDKTHKMRGLSTNPVKTDLQGFPITAPPSALKTIVLPMVSLSREGRNTSQRTCSFSGWFPRRVSIPTQS